MLCRMTRSFGDLFNFGLRLFLHARCSGENLHYRAEISLLMWVFSFLNQSFVFVSCLSLSRPFHPSSTVRCFGWKVQNSELTLKCLGFRVSGSGLKLYRIGPKLPTL